jgi:glycosyltransferase involved in cell wall biosynthesis
VGGAEVYLENLLRHLSATHDRSELVLVCRRDQSIDAWTEELGKHCTVVRLDIVRPTDLLALAKLIRNATLVHINLSFPIGKYQFAAAFLAHSSRRPIVVTHHLALPVRYPWSALMRWLGRAAACHIAVSNHGRNVLMSQFSYAPDRVVVIHNGVDPVRFHPAADDARRAARRLVGQTLEGEPWGDDVLLACTVARLSRQKGLFELIGATAMIVKRLPDARVVVIGEGELRRRLGEQARSRGLDHFFFLAGALPRPRVAEWLAASDLFILPSRYEGGPATALMEAMACGCAVVATDVSGVSELISDELVGRLVPAQNVPALATAVVDLLADPAHRAAMAGSARQAVIENFTIAKCLELTTAILEGMNSGQS